MTDAPFLLEDFLPYALSVAANHTSRLFARHYSREFGLSIAEWRVMAVLGRFGTLSPRAIAERTEMDKVKVSRAAANLVSAGLANRAPDPADGRGHRLSLTDTGRATHAAIVPRAQALEAELRAALPPPEWSALLPALRAVASHARMLEDAEQELPP